MNRYLLRQLESVPGALEAVCRYVMYDLFLCNGIQETNHVMLGWPVIAMAPVDQTGEFPSQGRSQGQPTPHIVLDYYMISTGLMFQGPYKSHLYSSDKKVCVKAVCSEAISTR